MGYPFRFPFPSLPFLPFLSFRPSFFSLVRVFLERVCARIGGKNTPNFYLCRKPKSNMNQHCTEKFSSSFCTKKKKRESARLKFTLLVKSEIQLEGGVFVIVFLFYFFTGLGIRNISVHSPSHSGLALARSLGCQAWSVSCSLIMGNLLNCSFFASQRLFHHCHSTSE